MRTLSVVAALLENPRGEILMAKRPLHKAHGGLWEFPGGKIDVNESAADALQRELQEELGLSIAASTPFTRTQHQYADWQLDLQVLRVQTDDAQVRDWIKQNHKVGEEGQALRWVAPARLHRLAMPEADRPIAKLLGLPPQWLITPEPPAANAPSGARRLWLEQLEHALVQGQRLVLFRAKQQPLSALRVLACLARDLVAHHGGEIVLHDDFELCQSWRFGGVHLSGKALKKLKARTLAPEFWLSASCHDAEQLAKARALACDFVSLAPVQATTSHPGAAPLGWSRFAELVQAQPLPVYALGGLSATDLPTARAHGACGIAGISGFWGSDSKQ